jgi:hypothetical protein
VIWHFEEGQADSDFGTDGAVIWTVEVRNNTGAYVRRVRIDLTTYDSMGRVVDSDFMYVSGLAPSGVKSGKGYATYYGTERDARVEISSR